MKNRLRAGVSLVDISPGPGIELAGYPHHPRYNTGIHDPLYAGCICLDDAEGVGTLVEAVGGCKFGLLAGGIESRGVYVNKGSEGGCVVALQAPQPRLPEASDADLYELHRCPARSVPRWRTRFRKPACGGEFRPPRFHPSQLWPSEPLSRILSQGSDT